MVTHIKKMFNEILNEYDDIRNCKLVKYDIRLNDKRPIKHK